MSPRLLVRLGLRSLRRGALDKALPPPGGAQREQRRALRQANAELAHYTATLDQLATSRERNRVARELHNLGDDVVVVGPGPMGIMGVQYAKHCGARRVFLIGLKSDEKRLRIGKQVGADYVLYSEDGPEKAVMEITGGKFCVQNPSDAWA